MDDQYQSSRGQPATYQIQVQGWIAPRWRHWFDDLSVVAETGDDGTRLTTLTGSVVDQAELRGILNKLWDLNLTLIAVELRRKSK